MQEFEFGKEDENTSAFKTAFKLALADIKNGVKAVPIWSVLGWQDIKQRYRRSVLGPFWLTISTAIMVSALGVLYAELLGQNIENFIPHVGAGLIVWTLLSTLILESATIFVNSEGIIKQIKMPLTVHVCRMVWRNIMIFAHNVVILLCLLYFIPSLIIMDLLTIPLGVFLIALNGVWIGLVVGIICTRYRDVTQILTSLVLIMFYVTPIFWKPELLVERGWIAQYNPAYHFIELIRSPLLGHGVPGNSWLIALSITFFGFFLAIIILAKYRSRVAYWL
jgi:ABC-type polysaccharide/polyol phosphate export permease